MQYKTEYNIIKRGSNCTDTLNYILYTREDEMAKWHRVIKIVVALAAVVMLIVLPSLVGASPDTETPRRPNGAGDETNLTPNTGANWAAVSEATSDDDTTYVASDAKLDTYQTDLYNLSDIFVLTGRGKINSVTVYINARAGGTPIQVSAYTRIKTGGIAYDGTAQTLTTAYATYSTAYPTNPQSGSEWTWAEINALQAGVGLRRALKTGGDKTSKCTQVWVVVDYTPATLESYDDAIQSTVWGTPGDPYANETNTTTVYMYGQNYIASHGYTVGYYDNAGIKAISHSTSSLADNTLSSQYLLGTDDQAEAGTWHAVVFDDDLGTPPPSYADTPSTDGYMVEDSFEVSASAIPEFPTVMAAIVVTGLCFGAYYWMRKRRLAYVKA